MSREVVRGAHSAPEPVREPVSRTKVAIVILVVIAALAVVYLGLAIYFTSHFAFNTTLNGQDVSLQTLDEVEGTLEDQVAGYSLTLEEIDGTTDSLGASEVGLAYVSDDQARQLLEGQNALAWIVPLIKGQASQIRPTVTYDADKVQAALDAKPFMDAANMVAPTDATVGFDQDTSTYVVEPEQWGDTIDTDVIYSAVDDALANFDQSLNLKDAGCYVAPAVYSDDAGLAAKADACNTCARGWITYDLGDAGTVTLDGTTAADWVVIGDDGTATLDDAQVKSWVANTLAPQVDTVGTTRSFTTHSGSTIQVSGGTYGWKVDQDAEVAAIKSDLAAGNAVEREPNYSSTAASHAAPEWGSTYIEVSIPEQHLWYYENGQVVLESDVVTGLPTTERATCTGVYYISEKQSPSVLRGPKASDGSYEWESHVNYWMRITWSGTGFHDADGWRSSYGGSIYQTNGSHGCINMPKSAAASLYQHVSIGTPAILYD